MRRIAILFVIMSCTYRGSLQWRAGFPVQEASSEAPTAAEPTVPRPADDRAAEERARARKAVRMIGKTYDNVLAELAMAEQLVGTHQYEQAAKHYRAAEAMSRGMLAWFANDANQLGRGDDVRYPTERDGKLAEPALVAKLEAVHRQAKRKTKAAWDTAVAQLSRELGARGRGQQAVLLAHGRPEIAKTRRETCWVYRAPVEETYCWRKNGVLARHDRATTPPDADQQTPWQPVEEPALSQPKAPPVQVARPTRRPPARASTPVVATRNDDAAVEAPAVEETPAAAPDPAPSEPAAAPSNLPPATPGWSYWRKPGDCRAVLNHNDTYCETGDCKAILNHNDAYCDTGDCKAILTHNDAYCGTGDCKAEITHNDAYCDSGDCKALITKNDAYCNTGSCKAILTHNDAYCDRESP